MDIIMIIGASDVMLSNSATPQLTISGQHRVFGCRGTFSPMTSLTVVGGVTARPRAEQVAAIAGGESAYPVWIEVATDLPAIKPSCVPSFVLEPILLT